MESDQMESRMSMRSLFDMLLRSYTYYSSPRMAKRCMKAFDSGVSSKRVQSKHGLIDFNKSSLPRRVNFEKEHDVSDDEDWIKSSDDLEEMNQELSSEVGWKHG